MLLGFIILDENGANNPRSYSSDIYSSSGRLRISGSDNWADNEFNGTIDEVRIYNRALSPEEILEHYNELRNFARADLDDDGDVDIEDLTIIAIHFGKTSGYDPEADVVPNNEIDVFDVVFVASRFS
jgi:hypothetical protein